MLDWKNKNYKAQQKYTSTTLSTKSIDSLNTRLKKIYHTNDIHGQFLKKLQLLIFAYVSHRIPEISDTIKLIDDAMKAGFGWELGPFENWDIIGVKEIIQSMKENQISYAPWVDEMLAEGNNSFYKIEQGNVICYDISLKKYATSIEKIKTIILNNVRADKTVWKNSGCSILDIGDDVLCVEFQTKLNAIGGEVIEGINKAIDMATDQYRGIVLGNNAPHFSAGANLAMIFMLAIEQEYEELSMIIRQFQNTVMRLRHASIPIVAAPHGLTLGGGCEIVMHCDAAIIHSETYAGLVEVGVGLIPAGGGTKEMALRITDKANSGDPILPLLGERFTNIATAKTSTSAHEGFDLGIFDSLKDKIVMNLDFQISFAKDEVLRLSRNGYTAAKQRDDIMVMGKSGLSGLYAGLAGFEIGNYASEYDIKIAKKLAWVICGGDLSMPTKVTEQYLLDLEREAFLSLLGEKKTLERIEHMLKTGKPLRN